MIDRVSKLVDHTNDRVNNFTDCLAQQLDSLLVTFLVLENVVNSIKKIDIWNQKNEVEKSSDSLHSNLPAS
mgnify:FL=1